MTADLPDPTVIVFNHDGMGHAEPELAHRLARTYLQLLEVDDRLPASICFYAEGVRLVVEGSPVLEELRALQEAGVDLIACGTCLSHYGLTERVGAGRVGSMKEIMEAQWQATRLIVL